MNVSVPRGRLVALLVAMSVCFAGLVWRLADVQGVSAERYAVFGESQRLESRVLPADRGSILDRNGAELAISLRRRTVCADPTLVKDPVAAAHALAPVLGFDEDEVYDQLTADTQFAYLARTVEDDVAVAVDALALEGVFMIDEPKRYLPSGTLAGPVLGEVGSDDVGLSGLELQYDEQLTGEAGELLVEKDVGGNDIAAGTRQMEPARRGDTLVLTIDQAMQYETERVLGQQIVNAKAKGGIAIVMDPRTGEILALANLDAGRNGAPPTPSFDNMAVTRVYEPGSTNKVVTIAAAVEEDLVEGDTRLSVPDNLRVADVVFKDDEPHEPAYWSVEEIMAESSNVGTIMIGQRLGRDRVHRYLQDFGMAEQSALDFPGESGGILPSSDEWSGTSIATVPIGQGVAVTALQMLGAYNTIANGGTYVAPRLVRGVVDASGKLREPEVEEGHRVVSEETAAAVTRMLVRAVAEGTGTAAAFPNYMVAGKTGTAGKPRENALGYMEGAYVASFAGFVPASAPRLSAIVILDEPTPIYGGIVSAPVFSHLAAAGTRLFDIPPEPAGDAPLSSSSQRDLAAGTVNGIRVNGGAAGGGIAGREPGGRYARAFADESLTSHVRLDQLLGDVEVLQLRGDPDRAGTDVVAITATSQAVVPGSLFCCIRGGTADGHDFAPAAVAAGAVALLCERPIDPAALPRDVPQAIVADGRAAMARAAATLYDHPSRRLAVVGVTGTNGKTTTTHLLKAVLEADGRRTEVIGTLSGARTTPEAIELQAALAGAAGRGTSAVALEVSSHALTLHRVDSIWFSVAVFTNLSPEHLDFHGDMDDYFAAKAALFTPDRARVAVVNGDDPWGRRLLAAARLPTRSFSLAYAAGLEIGPEGARFRWEGHPVWLRPGGTFNVANALAAATAARELDVAPAVVADGLSSAVVVPGRLEAVDRGQPFRVLVDYAHTPAGLEACLRAAREMAGSRSGDASGRVVVVFGCGGDRDRAKRPLMGEVAAHGADLAVLTSDNPRSEDPQAIIDDVLAGVASRREGPSAAAGRRTIVVEPDRRAAIALALSSAGPGDVVVLAGKGHETTQIIGTQVIPFDDRAVAAEELARLAAAAGGRVPGGVA